MLSPVIIPFLVFMGVIKMHQLGWFHWVFCACVVVFLPFLLMNVLLESFNVGTFLNIPEIFTSEIITTIVIQFVAALGYFYYMSETKDGSITGWVISALLGFFGLFVVIPYFVGLIV